MAIAVWTYLLFFVFYRREDDTFGTLGTYDEDGNHVSQYLIREESESYQAVFCYLAIITRSLLLLIEIYLTFGESIRRHCFNKQSLISLFTASGIKA